ncbi:Marine sediment metagenome DNA, contig: S01H4_S12859 (Fragment) OS=marine sediment metagenome GN=S01H4_49482 PE=4 SV=1 [Gemmataceae bacterium]
MRGLFLAAGLAAVVALAGGFAAADDKTYDLRGPAPTKGQVFVSKMTLKIKDADTTLKVMGMNLKLKMTMNVQGEEEQKVLTVDGRNVTKSQSKIVKERAEITTDFGGMNQAMTQPTELEGEVVISERVGDKWKHSLVDTKPTDKQKKELDNRNGIENEDDLYPAEKVKVGHTWKVEAKALTKLFGNSFTDIKGELSQKFAKVETVEGEECAVVESEGSVKGKMKDDDGKPSLDVEMDLKVKSWRSIKTGVELKGTFEGKIKLAGKQKIDEQPVDITLAGPLSGESSTRLK